MSVSAIFGLTVVAPPHSSAAPLFGRARIGGSNGIGGLGIVCSSRPKKKSTAHHIKTRPRKTQPWDIKRKPTVYPPLPPLPPDWTLVSSAADEEASVAVESPVATTPAVVESPVAPSTG